MNTFKMTKKGNVKEIDEGGSVLNKYIAVPFTSCSACVFIEVPGCGGAVCDYTRRAALGLPDMEVQFVLKVKEPKEEAHETPAQAIRRILLAAGLTDTDATRAGVLASKNPQHTVEWVKANTPADILWRGFGWTSTVEGHEHWRLLARQLG